LLPQRPFNFNEKAPSSGRGFFQFVKPGNSKCKDDHEGIGLHVKVPVFNDTGFGFSSGRIQHGFTFSKDDRKVFRIGFLLSDWFSRIPDFRFFYCQGLGIQYGSSGNWPGFQYSWPSGFQGIFSMR
jgi:hypothetical protein